MDYSVSALAIGVFLGIVGVVLFISFWMGRKAKDAAGYYAAHGQIPWFVNGVAFAGDYLSAASFLGICGYIAFYGYDGFLYAIGFLAGWVVALLVIAEPIKRLGKFTFADALDAKFGSRGLRMAGAVSTLVVSLFYLIPQMVGAGTLVKPLLGLPFEAGVVGVGVIVMVIVVTAGMVSTTWVQFIKGSLLVVICGIVTGMVLHRGLEVKPVGSFPRHLSTAEFREQLKPDDVVQPNSGVWAKEHFARVKHGDGSVTVWRYEGMQRLQLYWAGGIFFEGQMVTVTGEGKKLVNGLPAGGANQVKPVGFVEALAGGQRSTGPVGPWEFLQAVQGAEIGLTKVDVVAEPGVGKHSIYTGEVMAGNDVLVPGNHPTLFAGLRTQKVADRWNFVSLMLALFLGTAALPHILIRYYTVKDGAAARKSTVVGIGVIGLFYVMTLYLGLGAMTSGALDPTDSNMAAPLLAKTFGIFVFALISAIAFTTVLGTVSGLIMAASGAVAHDLMSNVMGMTLSDHGKVKAGKVAAVCVGAVGIVLGILFQKMNVAFLVAWAFNVAASANLPAIVMLLFWKRTTKAGIVASILVGLLGSVGWILLSGDAFVNLYGMKATSAVVPFNQPAVVTVPVAFLVLVVVSLLTRRKTA